MRILRLIAVMLANGEQVPDPLGSELWRTVGSSLHAGGTACWKQAVRMDGCWQGVFAAEAKRR